MTTGISTWVHHLTEALTAGNLYIFSPDEDQKDHIREDSRVIAGLLPTLPLFVFQQNGEELMNSALFDHAHETWAGLPFPNMLLETSLVTDVEVAPDRYVIAAHQTDDGRVVIELWVASDDPALWWCDFGVVVLTPRNGELFCEHSEPPNVPGKYLVQMRATIETATGMLIGFLGLMNTPALETEKHSASSKLNKARVKRGRAPIPTYTAITLRLPKRKPGETTAGAPSGRTSPRIHWRAGHKREYRPGLWTLVAPTIVGAKGESITPPPPKYNVVVDLPKEPS